MVAAATERLRLGTFVSNVDLRHPAVLAQDFASLDVLSGSRLEIGIGSIMLEPLDEVAPVVEALAGRQVRE